MYMYMYMYIYIYIYIYIYLNLKPETLNPIYICQVTCIIARKRLFISFSVNGEMNSSLAVTY
jgi:hypothetical protein